MMQYVYTLIPERVKICMDTVAVFAAFFSLPVINVISGLTAALASAAAFVYTVIRIHYYLKDRRDNNRS